MNFIKHRNGWIIIQGEKDTLCKQMDNVQTIPLKNMTKNFTEELIPKEAENFVELNFKIENEFLRQRLEPLIEKLKKDGTIGENPVRNINRVKVICKFEIINLDLRITCLVIKATP